MSTLAPIAAQVAVATAAGREVARSATDPSQRVRAFEELHQEAQERQGMVAGQKVAGAPPPAAGVSGVISARDEGKLKKALGEFEAIFLQQMLASMRKNVPASGGVMGQDSQGEKMFRDLLDTEYAKVMSQRTNRQGLKESMFDQMTRQLKQGRSLPPGSLAKVQGEAAALKEAAPGAMNVGGGSGLALPATEP